MVAHFLPLRNTKRQSSFVENKKTSAKIPLSSRQNVLTEDTAIFMAEIPPPVRASTSPLYGMNIHAEYTFPSGALPEKMHKFSKDLRQFSGDLEN
jgi:hypothetical protein